MQPDFLEPLLSAKDAAKADRHTERALGISASELMERAGLAIAKEIEVLLKAQEEPLPSVPVAIFCGPGNNGGDGWVAARRLWQNGIRTAVFTLVNPETLKAEARLASKHFLSAAKHDYWTLPDLNNCVQQPQSGVQAIEFLNRIESTVVVDAIFGTGLKRPAEGLFSEVIQELHRYKLEKAEKLHILAIDMPSGLPSDGQAWQGLHVHADSTLAIQFRKLTHVSGPHWISCGTVSCVDIGMALAGPSVAQVLLAQNQPPLSLLRPPKPSYYKGNYGHVGVLYGSFGIQGASELCAYSSLRSGAGLVTLLLPGQTQIGSFIAPEIMRRMIPSPLTSDALSAFSAFVIGTGVGESRIDAAAEIITWALSNSHPIIVDAGALPLLKDLEFPSRNQSQIIATPHPGEAARLLNITTAEVENDRVKAAHALLSLSDAWPADVTWVLKGACPIIAHSQNGLIVCEGGISTLSVGGSGDVLSGLCGALLAQTDSAFTAALVGVATHLEAGRRLLKQQTRGFIAREIADELPKVLFSNK